MKDPAGAPKYPPNHPVHRRLLENIHQGLVDDVRRQLTNRRLDLTFLGEYAIRAARQLPEPNAMLAVLYRYFGHDASGRFFVDGGVDRFRAIMQHNPCDANMLDGAVSSGFIEVVRTILSQNPDYPFEWTRTMERCDDCACIETLLQHESIAASLSSSTLSEWARKNDTRLVQLFIEHGPRVVFSMPFVVKTAIEDAVRHENVEMLQSILSVANVSVLCVSVAIKQGRFDMIRILAESPITWPVETTESDVICRVVEDALHYGDFRAALLMTDRAAPTLLERGDVVEVIGELIINRRAHHIIRFFLEYFAKRLDYSMHNNYILHACALRTEHRFASMFLMEDKRVMDHAVRRRRVTSISKGFENRLLRPIDDEVDLVCDALATLVEADPKCAEAESASLLFLMMAGPIKNTTLLHRNVWRARVELCTESSEI